ncbi:hypothetical protein BWI15_29445 [Kribbella sp. ALI-6-A]|nr:hypothetical protein BWI15_29445 [Kribbella sp. ALI-6-A]
MPGLDRNQIAGHGVNHDGVGDRPARESPTENQMISTTTVRTRALALVAAGATVIGTALLAPVAAGAAPASTAVAAAPAQVRSGVPFTLKPGEILRPGQYRRSWNNKYTFIMQKDGNAVLYQGRTALWSTATKVKGSSIALQRDGNLVVFLSTRAIWHSNTAGKKPSGLVVQDDGNLVMYDTAKRAYWSRWTVIETLAPGRTLKTGQLLYSRNGMYRLQMQADGNLVLVKAGKTPLWSTRTTKKGAFAIMQTDGNLVVYVGRTALWSSRTTRKGSILQMQGDGNLVIYSGRTPVWSTGTAGR